MIVAYSIGRCSVEWSGGRGGRASQEIWRGISGARQIFSLHDIAIRGFVISKAPTFWVVGDSVMLL